MTHGEGGEREREMLAAAPWSASVAVMTPMIDPRSVFSDTAKDVGVSTGALRGHGVVCEGASVSLPAKLQASGKLTSHVQQRSAQPTTLRSIFV